MEKTDLYWNTPDGTINKLQLTKPLQISWEPKEDITTHELALCMPLLIHYHNGIMPSQIDQSEPHLRHFKIIDTNK